MDLKLGQQLSNAELGLIQVPYSLNVIDKSELFSKIFCFNNKITTSLAELIFHPLRIFSLQKHVQEEINPVKDDILLVHTDMDLLNQYIIQVFYNRGARVFLLEDGTSTMCTFNLIPQKPPLKDRVKAIILQRLYGFRYTSIALYGRQILPVMKDYVFNGLIVNYGNSVLRDMPVYKLSPVNKPVRVVYENGAIFLSQALYLWYLTEKEFITYLSGILSVSENFDRFYFKFHPSDSEAVKTAVTKLINEKFSKIILISENQIAEELISKYPVRYAITFNSTSVLNLISRGVIPFFLNNLLNKAFPDSTLNAFDQFLKSINCRIPETLSDVRPGFKAFEGEADNSNTKSISDILN